MRGSRADAPTPVMYYGMIGIGQTLPIPMRIMAKLRSGRLPTLIWSIFGFRSADGLWSSPWADRPRTDRIWSVAADFGGNGP